MVPFRELQLYGDLVGVKIINLASTLEKSAQKTWAAFKCPSKTPAQIIFRASSAPEKSEYCFDLFAVKVELSHRTVILTQLPRFIVNQISLDFGRKLEQDSSAVQAPPKSGNTSYSDALISLFSFSTFLAVTGALAALLYGHSYKPVVFARHRTAWFWLLFISSFVLTSGVAYMSAAIADRSFRQHKGQFLTVQGVVLSLVALLGALLLYKPSGPKPPTDASFFDLTQLEGTLELGTGYPKYLDARLHNRSDKCVDEITVQLTVLQRDGEVVLDRTYALGTTGGRPLNDSMYLTEYNFDLQPGQTWRWRLIGARSRAC